MNISKIINDTIDEMQSITKQTIQPNIRKQIVAAVLSKSAPVIAAPKPSPAPKNVIINEGSQKIIDD